MKNLHRGKAIEAYQGARLVLKDGMVYPGYMMLKESLRGTLAYINEDIQGRKYSEKTRLRTLIDEAPVVLTTDVATDVFKKLLELEDAGLYAIMNVDISELEEIRKALKKVIGLYLGEKL